MEDDLLEDDEISFEDDGFGQQDVEHVLLDEDWCHPLKNLSQEARGQPP